MKFQMTERPFRREIAASAVEEGQITAEQLQRCREYDKLACLLPGVSTAEKLTNVSGRGVGMDVVKTNLDASGERWRSTPSWQGFRVSD